MGKNEYGESGHLSIFTLLKHLMMLLKYMYNFFRASFRYHFHKVMAQRALMRAVPSLRENGDDFYTLPIPANHSDFGGIFPIF